MTTLQFHAAVHALSPRVAVFDCDGTLWSGDAGSAFMRYTIETKLLSLEKVAWINQRYAAYNTGHVSELDICGGMVQVYAGIPESTLRAAAATFFRTHIEPHIFTALHHLISTLQQQNVDIWAVSSTNNWVIEEGVRRFDIPPTRVLAAQVEIHNGLATDRLIAVPTDQLKVEALHRAGITAPDAVFGNSIHDAAMLAIARRAFPVNPTPALATLAATNNWPIYHPS